MKFLIDTDWVINHLRGKDETRLKLKEFRSFGLGISVISVAELYEGVYQSKNPNQAKAELEALLSLFSSLGIDRDICRIFGQERARLRKQGKLIDNFDLMIASTAIYHNLILLTNNRKHFEEIEGLKIISI